MTDHLDTIREAVAKLEAQAGHTPTAFNWTPEMEAIWPKDMRPSMSGLLAIWEALHGAAVYGDEPVADEDGWIEHHGCGLPDLPRDTRVDTRHRSGVEFTGGEAWRVEQWHSGAGFWEHDGKFSDITHYRVAK